MTHHDVLDMDNETVSAPSTPTGPLERSSRQLVERVLRQSAYVVGGYVIDVAAFCVVLVMLAAGIPMSFLLVGLPVLYVGLALAGGFAAIERHRVAVAAGTKIPHPSYRQAHPSAGRLQRFFTPFTDAQRWFEVMWTQVNFVVATVAFGLACTWLAGAISVIAAPILTFVTRDNPDFNSLPELLGVHHWAAEALIEVLIGLAFCATLPAVMRLLTLTRATASAAMLGTRPGYEQQLSSLRDSRSAQQQAESASLRRLERDIHDGPQQRLIRLQMDLSRAQRAAGADPERAAHILADARVQTQETLDELRSLSRGIAPPVLVDRGLSAALDELAWRSEVPTSVDGAVGRLPHEAATAAYFVTAEALANVNKHSQATHALVRIGVTDGQLCVSIADDGVGGASVSKGHGLAGLAERLRGMDGHLEIESPVGGPTSISAKIPVNTTPEVT